MDRSFTALDSQFSCSMRTYLPESSNIWTWWWLYSPSGKASLSAIRLESCPLISIADFSGWIQGHTCFPRSKRSSWPSGSHFEMLAVKSPNSSCYKSNCQSCSKQSSKCYWVFVVSPWWFVLGKLSCCLFGLVEAYPLSLVLLFASATLCCFSVSQIGQEIRGAGAGSCNLRRGRDRD